MVGSVGSMSRLSCFICHKINRVNSAKNSFASVARTYSNIFSNPISTAPYPVLGIIRTSSLSTVTAKLCVMFCFILLALMLLIMLLAWKTVCRHLEKINAAVAESAESSNESKASAGISKRSADVSNASAEAAKASANESRKFAEIARTNAEKVQQEEGEMVPRMEHMLCVIS